MASSSSGASDLCFVTSKRGGVVLLHGGHQYNKKRDNKNGTTLWHCIHRSTCHGRITTKEMNILNEVNHQCEANFATNEIKKKLEECKTKAANETRSLQKIYNEAMTSLTDSGINIVAKIPEFANVKHGLYNSRKKGFGIDRIVEKDMLKLRIPEKYSDFLLADYNDDTKRILVFANQEARKNITKIKDFFADGTFRCVVKPFYQLYTIFGDIYSDENSKNVVPLIYALLPDKKQDTYEKLFSVIKLQLPNWCPSKMTTDYEKAAMNAIKVIFPNVTIGGCYFHFSQALCKKAKKLNVFKEPSHKRHIALCAALSLVPLEEVDNGWLYIMEDCPTENKNVCDFNDYFINTWLKDEHLRSRWNFCGQIHRTTNNVEGWHSKINKYLNGKTKPNILKFLEILDEEASLTTIKMAKFENVASSKNRRNSDIEKDRRISFILEQFHNKDITLGHCLEKLLTYVFKK